MIIVKIMTSYVQYTYNLFNDYVLKTMKSNILFLQDKNCKIIKILDIL